MEGKKNQRFYEFSVVLNPVRGQEIDWKLYSDDEKGYMAQLNKINFISPSELASILTEFKGISQNSTDKKKIRHFTISEFRGQLERGSENCKPHYNLAIKTSVKVLASSLVRELSQTLYGVNNDKSVNVEPAHDFDSLVKYSTKNETRLELLGSKYYPPYVDSSVSQFIIALQQNPDLAKCIPIQDFSSK